ncbi:MAG: hypothetical protein WCE53_15455 [Candidatus Acidiferrum sp.]
MKRLGLGILILALANAGTFAQSTGGETSPTGCKTGNLEQERAPVIESMRHFLAELKTAIRKGDKREIARMVQYPLNFSTMDATTTIHSEQEFIDKYDRILPKELKEFLLRQEPQCIGRVGARGFSVGSGEIWFDIFDDGKVKIFAINAVVYPGE